MFCTSSAELTSIRPTYAWRDTGHKALMPGVIRRSDDPTVVDVATFGDWRHQRRAQYGWTRGV
eukprot:COSAG02_NODE_1709_length_11226_cov_5.225937_8_plen_63_part_00